VRRKSRKRLRNRPQGASGDKKPSFPEATEQNQEETIEVPTAWKDVEVSSLNGILMVLGEPDVGKSTFSQYLYRRLCSVGSRVAYLDGDPGQSILGPPCTMTLALAVEGDDAFPPQGRIWRRFTGSTSPRGHMLQILIGAARLTTIARQEGVEAIVYDTTGFVNPVGGGILLKLAKIDLLHSEYLFAIQHDEEMEPLLEPLWRSHRAAIVRVPCSSAAQRIGAPSRRAHRAAQYSRYFSPMNRLQIDWGEVAVFPASAFQPNRLVAMEDDDGFTIGLGVVERVNPESCEVTILTPLGSLKDVNALHLGDVAVDLESFQDWQLRFVS
jgi:polynucleotide 5'-hydroxyl-kinase GRC3/NOL9